MKTVALFVLFVIQWTCALSADGPIRDLATGEEIAVLGSPVALQLVAQALPVHRLQGANHDRHQVNTLDRFWRRRLHGGEGRQTNFLDNRLGSMLAPAAGFVTLSLLDINRREFSRDIPYFIAGAVATGALTKLSKRTVYRPRPYSHEGGFMPPNRSANDHYHSESFFSGHASQAFYTAAFVNNRLRRHMRQEWSHSGYRTWRWTSPLLSYGWATLVGLSRVHADQHYFTDVAAGALAGWAVGELYYRICYEQELSENPEASSGLPTLTVRFSF